MLFSIILRSTTQLYTIFEFVFAMNHINITDYQREYTLSIILKAL